MILTSAFEFSSRHGSKIKERPTDDEVLSKVSYLRFKCMDHMMLLLTDHYYIIAVLQHEGNHSLYH